jgi:hypothetical protein
MNLNDKNGQPIFIIDIQKLCFKVYKRNMAPCFPID